jgi:hypothetical protein
VFTSATNAWLKLLNCKAITILLPANPTVIPLLAGAITTHWVAVSTIKSLIRQRNSLIFQGLAEVTTPHNLRINCSFPYRLAAPLRPSAPRRMPSPFVDTRNRRSTPVMVGCVGPIAPLVDNHSQVVGYGLRHEWTSLHDWRSGARMAPRGRLGFVARGFSATYIATFSASSLAHVALSL